ncbi:GNAT family N-acetyltransferase [Roseobacter ponti]|uniref:GNAT family N-acetyltransferase n=1 Tax=Roseobacter ponti TaxID=1891787 RepID=A0A858SMG0_9RHOB|nr:GNAT family protein [Roseobacter ponti]QJF50024.1 GNAT family N-acetyltransferase [Roseobacter ponti]
MTKAPALGAPVPGWSPPPRPAGDTLTGARVRLEALNADAHAAELFDEMKGHDRLWDYMPYGPFAGQQAYAQWIGETVADDAHLFYAIRNLATGRAEGVASYLRINPGAGSIEVGHICLSPALQQTPAATEAMFLMMQWAFEAGYRRYEWKCNALNIPSRRAAQRLGLSYEGVFRQAAVIKERNRDTAWFAAIDSEWPRLQTAFSAWLAPSNFDDKGAQRQPLGAFTAPVLAAEDPVFS